MSSKEHLLTEEKLQQVIEAVVAEINDPSVFSGNFFVDATKGTITFILGQMHYFESLESAADELEEFINRNGATVSEVEFEGEDTVIFHVF